MRKKFFAIYALAGALVASPVFTSCVDDAESPSVENIRNEKANQLKALAALQNAQAEAAKTTANAEAALKAAQAAYQQAQTAYQQALTEAKQADTAYQAEMLKQAQEKFAIELEQIKAQAEQQISYAQLQAMKNMAAIEDLEIEELKNLYYELQNAISSLNYLNNQKLWTTNSYNQAKAGLEFTEADAEAQIKYYDKQIARQEFIIATYEKYEGADLEKIYQDMKVAQKEAQKLNDAAIPYQEAANEAWDAYSEANNAYWENNYGFYYWDNTKDLALLDLINDFRSNGNTWWEGNLEISTYQVIKEESLEMPNGSSIQYYTFNETMADLVKAKYNQSVEDQKLYIGHPSAEATETTAAVAASGIYSDIEYYENTITQWKEEIAAWEEELEADPTKTWLSDNIAYRKNDIARYETYKADVEFRLEAANVELANREAKVAKVEALEAAFAADSEEMVAYEAAIAAHKALAEAAEELKEAAEKADEALEKANEAASEKWNEYNVLQNKYYNSTDVESYITNAQNSITNYKRWKQDYLNNVANDETNIAVLEAELLAIEAQIAAQEAIIAGLQAEIEALTETEEEA